MPTPFNRARNYDAEAATTVLSQYYPQVVRIAHALCGQETAAMRVVRFVMSRSIRVLPKCRDEESLQRWLYHHTLLARRHHCSEALDPRGDVIAVFGGTANPAYAAFVRALRNLPVQQREAILLHHGEHLNARYLGVAMDCSATAADNHLKAATAALTAVGGEQTAELLNQLSQAYARLKPREDVIVPMTRGYVAGYLRPRRYMRWLRRLLLLAILVIAGYIGWRFGIWDRLIEAARRYLPQ